MKIKVKNNHASPVNRAGFTFGPDEVKEIEVNEEEKFRIEVVRYLEVTEVEENTGEDDIGPKEEKDTNPEPDLETMIDSLSVNQLQSLAKKLEMSGYSKLNKEPLIDEIVENNEENKIREVAAEVFPLE